MLIGTTKRLEKHPVYTQVQDTVSTLCTSILDRTIACDVVEELLPRSQTLDDHRTLALYGEACKLKVGDAECGRVIEGVRALREAQEALGYVLEHHCDNVTDRLAFADALQFQRDLAGVALTHAESEDRWGRLLTKDVREVAAMVHRLQGSKLFCDEWRKARNAAGDASDLSEQPPALALEGLVGVGRTARCAFDAQCEDLINDEQLITVGAVAHIFEQPQSRDAVGNTLRLLPIELRRMFPEVFMAQARGWGESRQLEARRAAVRRLSDRLQWFAKMVQSMLHEGWGATPHPSAVTQPNTQCSSPCGDCSSARCICTARSRIQPWRFQPGARQRRRQARG